MAAGPVNAQALTPAFIYQGELRLASGPATASFDMQFRLFSAATDGAQIGATVTATNVAVSGGLFSVPLDFGVAQFAGERQWLEIAIRPAGSGSYETLSPRTEVTAAPYAWGAAVALGNSVTTTSIVDGTVGVADINATQVQRRVAGSCAAGQYVRIVNENGSVTCGTDATGTGWSLTGNAGTNSATEFIGTTDNQPLVLRANNQQALRIEPNATSPNLIGGHGGNAVTAGVAGATIGGGGATSRPNRITDNYGTVGGGRDNRAGDNAGGTDNMPDATVGGGESNFAIARASTVGGGTSNVASGNGATVGGGQLNAASGIVSTIGGGSQNAAIGGASTVGGGTWNCAGGDHSWAGGNGAKVRPANDPGGGSACRNLGTYPGGSGDAGTFMWADSQNADVVSTGNNQFLVRANGGVWFGTNSTVSIPAGRFINTSTGAYLTNTGVWTNASSRALKTGFLAVDPADVLARVLELGISTWRYRASDVVRHMGPMAEDFHALFGLGGDDVSISTVDASGVALAAIQGLNAKVEGERDALRTENASLRDAQARLDAENAALRAESDALRARIARIEARLDAPEAVRGR
jgi:hypothetical protein